jgi:hypothetical protein
MRRYASKKSEKMRKKQLQKRIEKGRQNNRLIGTVEMIMKEGLEGTWSKYEIKVIESNQTNRAR